MLIDVVHRGTKLSCVVVQICFCLCPSAPHNRLPNSRHSGDTLEDKNSDQAMRLELQGCYQTMTPRQTYVRTVLQCVYLYYI